METLPNHPKDSEPKPNAAVKVVFLFNSGSGTMMNGGMNRSIN
ncbi:MAG: hypothetical protein ACYDA4_17205 [Ignavibacteriaceae bacterium]